MGIQTSVGRVLACCALLLGGCFEDGNTIVVRGSRTDPQGSESAGNDTNAGNQQGGSDSGSDNTGGGPGSPPALFPKEVMVRSEPPGTGVPPAGADRCDPLDPAYCLFPFPNNYFTQADPGTDNRMRVNLNLLSMPRNVAGKPIDPSEWGRNDGFSPGQPMLTLVPGLDLKKTSATPLTDLERSLAKDQPIVLIDTLTLKPQLTWSELDVNATAGALAPLNTVTSPQSNAGSVLAIRAAKNLVPGRRYIVAMRRLKNAAGETIEPNTVFKSYRDKQPLSNAVQEARRPLMENLFSILQAAGVAREDLYLAWDFTVASRRNLTERVLHMRDESIRLTQGKSPAFTIDSVINNPDNGGASAITAQRIRGHVEVPCFLSTPNCVSGGTFNYPPQSLTSPATALPQRNPATPTAKVPFICSVARTTLGDASDPTKATVARPARPSLYGHGLLGSRDEGNTYDLNVREMAQRHNMLFCMVDWAGLATGNQPDDQADPQKYDPLWDMAGGDLASTVGILTDFSGFARLADRLQQSFLNFVMLGRAMMSSNGFCSHPAFQVKGQCIINTEALYYDGNSQGGINGGPVIAISPDIVAGTLGVPGMAYSILLQRSVDFAPYAPAMYNAYPGTVDQQFILSLVQMLWDRAENNGYAFSLAPGQALAGTKPNKRVLLLPAFGDHQVTMTSAEIMARTIEAPVHCPAVVGGPSVQRGLAVLKEVHPAVVAEKEQFPLVSFGRRHPDDHPYFGLPCVPKYPFKGNGLTVWDSGPMVKADGSPSPSGNAPPPIENRPPASGYGADPHGHPRGELLNMDMKSAFLKTDGALLDVCKGMPCTSRGFDPSLKVMK
ncbi:hypothetical protein NQT62_08375 [Limnobacter humi]|uniref:Bacterial virulence factor lipase N-terminal domain-containing protein n=1 Tax=Limnobacter humi TaxID=1778671 RepID=A0ABT1WG02_9BURK|nr:hypothetical protein [Limnobacter humi]MCQ8896445.1 hypothetical protein [Limnobacter humi]